jgi:hypothetical protein
MSEYNSLRRDSSARNHRADFARQATIAEFGWRHARALDQADFEDRKPHLTRFGLVTDRIVQRLTSVREVQNGSL